MLSSNQAFLRLVRLGIGHSAEPLREPVDWNTMEALATKQGLLGVVLDGIQQLPDDQRPPKVQMLQWIGQVVQGYEQRYVEYRKAIDSLATFYTAHGFRMMLLKGYACGRDWPRPEHRPYGDIDIWLFGKQKEADALNLNQGDRNFYTQYIPSHLLKQIAKVCCVRHNTIIIGVVSLSG